MSQYISSKTQERSLPILLIVFTIFVFILLSTIGPTYASHIIKTSSGTTSFSVNDSTENLFNISVNNTDPGQTANITQVNVSFPSAASCTFEDESNGTDASGSFSNTSSVLTWENTTALVMNKTTQHFWFNLTCQDTGNYNIIVTSVNDSGSYSSNLSLEINDTASFGGNLFSPDTGTLKTTNTFNLTYNITGTGGATVNCTTYVWVKNYTGGMGPEGREIWSDLDNSTVSVGNGNHSYNMNQSDDGTFIWDVYCYNTSAGDDDLWLNVTKDSTLENTPGIWNFTIATYEVYGYAMNASNKSQGMNNTNVTLDIMYNWDATYKTYELQTNETGHYNFTNVSFPDGYFFSINLKVYNESNPEHVDYIGPSIPEFNKGQLTGKGEEEGSSMQNMSFYLKQGATINISAEDATGSPKNFEFYEVKDKKLGWPLGSGFKENMINNFTMHIPANRDYTVMLYPNQSLPVSIDINAENLTDDGYFNYTFNTSENFDNRLTGYAKLDGKANFSSMYFLLYLLEPGRMVYYGDHASALLNISGNDVYNKSTGWYNISVPGTAEDLDAIVMPIAYNESNTSGASYYGGFKSVSLDWDSPTPNQTNFTLQRFRGDHQNPDKISVDTFGKQPINNMTSNYINGTKFIFNVLKSDNTSASSPHVEMELDYSSLNMTNFTYMLHSSGQGANLAVPLLEGVGIKKANVFSQSGGAPLEKKVTNASLTEQGQPFNFTLGESMSMEDPDGGTSGFGGMYIDMIENTPQCNVPNYDVSECSYFGSLQSIAPGTDFDPFSVIMSGADISFVMKTGTNITIMYKGVDMLASGPPGSNPDSDSEDTPTSSKFEQAWKIGSNGPSIYDEIIIGIPYTQGSSSQTGFDESKQINMTIPELYGEDYSSPIWNSDSGDNTTNITTADVESELSDFQDYVGSEYESYLNGSYPECNESDENLTSGLCYKDKSNNMVWFRIPHFSGVSGTPTGNIITATTTTTDGGDGGDGGGVTTEVTPSASRLWLRVEAGVVKELQVEKEEIGVDKVQFSLKNPANSVQISVKKQEGKPADVEVNVSGKTYRYINIETQNINDTNVDEAKLRFTVNKSWIDENNIDPAKVYLNRYANNKWNKLETSKISETADNITYEAMTPGFSYFAVSGEEAVVEKEACPYECCVGMADYKDKTCPEGQECQDNTCVEVKECPTCPEPSEWSSCVEGTQTRTNYRCSEETNYECQSYEEEQSCEVPARPKVPYGLIAGAAIIIIIAALVYWKWKEFVS